MSYTNSMSPDQLSEFLKKAKKHTYASEEAKKVASQRPGSKDYEYKEGSWTYHDTYFGGVHFIGEEVVYKDGKPLWAMNYNGYVTDDSVSEAEIDKSLRGALKQLDYADIIPVRGPKNYKIENYEYKNTVKGTLDRFEGREEVFKDNKSIYYAVFHGGLIK